MIEDPDGYLIKCFPAGEKNVNIQPDQPKIKLRLVGITVDDLVSTVGWYEKNNQRPTKTFIIKDNCSNFIRLIQ